MDSMTLNLNKDALQELMKDFNLLTGMKIALFDADGNELLAYPDSHCPFCALMHENEKTKPHCLESNTNSFKRCQASRQLEIYHCHAGLVETTAPLIDNGVIIGYIMFGQITDNPDKSEVKKILSKSLEKYRLDERGYHATLYHVTYKNKEQIQAAAKILEACTFYVLLKDMITLQRESFLQNLNSFLLAHIDEDLSVDRLTEEFHISKNKLYDSCNRYLSTGIAEHIKKLRIEEAKRLLKETDLTVHEISDQIGFNDYNYFCRIFKKEVGIPAKKYKSGKRD